MKSISKPLSLKLTITLMALIILSLSFVFVFIPQDVASAYIRPNAPNDLFVGQTQATSGWLSAPENGFFFTLKCTDNSLLPKINILGSDVDNSSSGAFFLHPFSFEGSYYYRLTDGVNTLGQFPFGTDYAITYYSTNNLPSKSHIFLFRVDGVSYTRTLKYAKNVSTFKVSFENQNGLLHSVQSLRTSPYTFDKFVLCASRGIFETQFINNNVSFSDTQKYQEGFIAGSNNINTSLINIFPAFIGSILGFFLSIASYEVMGISLLNILIIAGSLLLLVAILRIFLK